MKAAIEPIDELELLDPTGKQLPDSVSQPECGRAGQSKVTPMRLWCVHFRLTLVGPCSNTHRVIFILWVELKQLRDALWRDAAKVGTPSSACRSSQLTTVPLATEGALGFSSRIGERGSYLRRHLLSTLGV